MATNGSRKVPPSNSPRCVSCRSKYIYERLRDGLWKCRTCDELFKMPITLEVGLKQNGSGIIAPLSYRAQLARERLAASAKCDGAAKFNPRGE